MDLLHDQYARYLSIPRHQRPAFTSRMSPSYSVTVRFTRCKWSVPILFGSPTPNLPTALVHYLSVLVAVQSCDIPTADAL
jgi:hypothetical protein